MFNHCFVVDATTPESNQNESPSEQATLSSCSSVVKSYETAAGEFRALNDHVDLSVDAGSFLAVVGKSGSGKSTLSNMITGIDRPTSGEVMVAGTPVHTMSEGQIASWRGRNIGVVFQFFQLLPTLTVAGKRHAAHVVSATCTTVANVESGPSNCWPV